MDPHPVLLTATEVLPDRPFTDPARTLDDLAALRRLARRLLEQQTVLAAAAPLERHFWREPEGRSLRIVLGAAGPLRQADHLTLVGFFGQRRPAAATEPMASLDEALIDEFTGHPDLLAYCSLELPDTNWGNLVVLAQAAARQRWNEGARHRQGVREVAPAYYASIRLHNAELPGGLRPGSSLQLVATKYYDYEPAQVWRGLRAYDPALSLAFL